MRDVIRVLILGTGQMGSGIARLVLEKQGLRLVGAYGRRTARAGMDLGRAIGLDRDLGIPVSGDLAGGIEQARPHVAIQATCSRLDDAMDEITTLLRHGVHVISIAEEMACPAAEAPVLAGELHQLAIDNGVAVLGTGINPGFVLGPPIDDVIGASLDVIRLFMTGAYPAVPPVAYPMVDVRDVADLHVRQLGHLSQSELNKLVALLRKARGETPGGKRC